MTYKMWHWPHQKAMAKPSLSFEVEMTPRLMLIVATSQREDRNSCRHICTRHQMRGIELGVDGFNSLWQILGQCRANREALQGQGENCNYDS